MSDVVIRVENISKLYRLGEVGTGSLAHDVNRWWHRVRGKEDPYLKIGEVNDRTKSVSSVQRPESSAKNANALAPQPSSLDSTPSSSSRPLDPGLSTPSSSALDSRPSSLDSPKAAPSDWVYALKDVSFEVKRGEVLGIIGRNGAGKSTLLKILSRVTTQSSGQIKVKGRIASLLEVGTGFNPILTGASGICFGFHRLKREPEGWPPARSRVLRLGEEARRKSNRRLARRVQHRGRCKSTAAAGRPGGLRDSASGS